MTGGADTYLGAGSEDRLVGPAGLIEGGEGGHLDVGRGGGWRPGLAGHYLVHHHVGRPPGATEGNLPAVQLPEEDPETVDITLGAGGLASQELRGLHSHH